jgi:hypothetical protein
MTAEKEKSGEAGKREERKKNAGTLGLDGQLLYEFWCDDQFHGVAMSPMIVFMLVSSFHPVSIPTALMSFSPWAWSSMRHVRCQ